MIDLSNDNRSKEKHPSPGYCLQTHAVELTFGWEVAHTRKERNKDETSINLEGANGNNLVWFYIYYRKICSHSLVSHSKYNNTSIIDEI